MLSIWVHAVQAEKFRKLAYKIVLQVRAAREEELSTVRGRLRAAWTRRSLRYFYTRWQAFMRYVHENASRVAKLFTGRHARRFGRARLKHMRLLKVRCVSYLIEI